MLYGRYPRRRYYGHAERVNRGRGAVFCRVDEEVAKDLVVSREYDIDVYRPELTPLEPGQTITIEYNATVVSCGVDNNTFVVKGNNTYSGNWAYSYPDVVTITVPCPSGDAADGTPRIKDVFTVGEPVYAVGRNFAPFEDVAIYITPVRTWANGEKITDYYVYASLLGTVQTDGDGNIAPVMIWPDPIPGEYDMVFDANQNTIYDFGIDAVDHPNHPGFTVAGTVPALTPFGIAVLVGLLSIVATSTLVRIRKKR